MFALIVTNINAGNEQDEMIIGTRRQDRGNCEHGEQYGDHFMFHKGGVGNLFPTWHDTREHTSTSPDRSPASLAIIDIWVSTPLDAN